MPKYLVDTDAGTCIAYAEPTSPPAPQPDLVIESADRQTILVGPSPDRVTLTQSGVDYRVRGDVREIWIADGVENIAIIGETNHSIGCIQTTFEQANGVRDVLFSELVLNGHQASGWNHRYAMQLRIKDATFVDVRTIPATSGTAQTGVDGYALLMQDSPDVYIDNCSFLTFGRQAGSRFHRCVGGQAFWSTFGSRNGIWSKADGTNDTHAFRLHEGSNDWEIANCIFQDRGAMFFAESDPEIASKDYGTGLRIYQCQFRLKKDGGVLESTSFQVRRDRLRDFLLIDSKFSSLSSLNYYATNKPTDWTFTDNVQV